ncbi:hypothetical protein ABXS75_16490 [Roseburia hominis]
MRAMRRSMRCLIAMLLAFLIFPASVSAEDIVSTRDNWVEFTKNHKMADNFAAGGITGEAKNDLQPGDTMTFRVNIRNTSADTTAWYMRNEVLQTLESQQSIAEGGAYTYVLTYIGPKETRVLYDSEAVGGSEESGEGSVVDGNKGLEQATVALDDEEYIYLDTLEAGAKAQMTLKIGLDGETQGNDYQDTLARVKLGFAVELVDTPAGTSTTPNKPDTPNPNRDVIKTPRTGDTSNVMLFSIMALIAGIVCIVLVFLRLKKRNDEKKRKRGANRKGGQQKYE